jgi:hypothetical protein
MLLLPTPLLSLERLSLDEKEDKVWVNIHSCRDISSPTTILGKIGTRTLNSLHTKKRNAYLCAEPIIQLAFS